MTSHKTIEGEGAFANIHAMMNLEGLQAYKHTAIFGCAVGLLLCLTARYG